MRINGLLAIALVTGAGLAHANGRAPGTSTINFRQGHDQDILAGMTFGNVISHDGGATWRWMCEDAVLYGGTYDPDYVYRSTGTVFATTFSGSLVMRDGCTFAPTQFGATFFSTITQGPDGALYMAAAEPSTANGPGDAAIYKSTDDGVTFSQQATAGQVGDWYNSLEVSPQNAQHVYLSGYRIPPEPTAEKTWQIYRSTDGGASFTTVTSTGFTTSMNSSIDIVGIVGGASDDTLYVRVSLQTGSIGDAIWKSTNSGQSWTKILDKQDEIAFVVRANGDLVAGTRNLGMVVSHDGGGSWAEVPGAPHVNCLVENAAHEVWACTQNDAVMSVPSDGAGILKTADLATWTKVLRYEDIAGPVECPAGTRQHDQCVYACPNAVFAADPATCPNRTPDAWCALKNQLGIATTAVACPALFDDTVPSELGPQPKPSGCCETGGAGGPAALALGLGVAAVIARRRRG